MGILLPLPPAAGLYQGMTDLYAWDEYRRLMAVEQYQAFVKTNNKFLPFAETLVRTSRYKTNLKNTAILRYLLIELKYMKKTTLALSALALSLGLRYLRSLQRRLRLLQQRQPSNAKPCTDARKGDAFSGQH